MTLADFRRMTADLPGDLRLVAGVPEGTPAFVLETLVRSYTKDKVPTGDLWFALTPVETAQGQGTQEESH